MNASPSHPTSSHAPPSAQPHGPPSGRLLPAFLSYLIACLPSLAFALLLCSYALFYYVQEVPGSESGIPGLLLAKTLAGTGAVLLLFLLLLPLVYGKRCLQRVVYSLLYSMMLCAVAIAVLERGLRVDIPIPATYHQSAVRYTSIQRNLQRLVERRGHQGSRVFRGVRVAHHYNSFGWPDKERAFSKQGTRILFIGDSFLQVRSTQNVAQRVETNLRLHGEDVEIINLSEDATSPRDYRYRLFEFAFDYEPDHIMVFLYGANDLSRTYKHRPYAPEPFYVTPAAVRILRSTGRYPEDVLQTLNELERQHQQFPRKEDLLAALDEYGLSIGDRAFVYFVTFAYSAVPSEGFPLERVAPHTLTRLTKLWETVFPNTAISRRQSAWRNRYEEFQSLTTFPREQQLRHIAERAAQNNRQSDPQPFLDKLQEIDSVWLDELLAGPDMTIFLWPAIKKLVLDQPEFKDPQPEAVEALIEQYLKLFGEFVEQSERHGIGISFVLIPEASQVDEGFYRFWLPVFDFRKWKAVAHANTSALAQQLPSLAPTLNLMEHKEQLGDSYWHFDGHWNERGNAVVAEIVTDYLLRNLEKIER